MNKNEMCDTLTGTHRRQQLSCSLSMAGEREGQSGQELKAGEDLEAEADAENTEKCCLPVCSP